MIKTKMHKARAIIVFFSIYETRPGNYRAARPPQDQITLIKGIIASLMERVAFGDPDQRYQESLKNPIFFESEAGIY